MYNSLEAGVEYNYAVIILCFSNKVVETAELTSSFDSTPSNYINGICQ